MSKKSKYLIMALGIGAILLLAVYFVFGTKKKEFTITFDSSGGSTVPSQVVLEKDKVAKPSDPTKENYTFVRWNYLNKEYVRKIYKKEWDKAKEDGTMDKILNYYEDY